MDVNEKQIFIKPERQRKDLGDLEPLKTSIQNIGLINPLVVEPREEEEGTFWLIAGERRLTAFRALLAEGRTESASIPVRLFSDLDESSRQMIELEENIKRKDLTWQENVLAVMKLKELKGFETLDAYANYLGISGAHLTRIASVWEMRDNEKVWGADNLSSAYTVYKRESQRILGSVTSDLNFMIQNFLGENEDEQGTKRTVDKRPDEGSKQINWNGRESTSSSRENITLALRGVPEVSAPETRLYPNYSIQQGDFLDWAKNYSGRPFNLLHLDFPYGINHDRSKQGNTKTFGTYSDTEDIYKTLVRGLLENQDRLVGESAHCICWLSLRFAEWTKKEFESAGWTCLLQPFIWHKSDNKGIIADTMCGMRNVGEYALVFIRGRRPVVKNISNIFPHPTTKVFHASEKPRAMLEYLYEAFCDKHTRLLDPTCGSGTSIQAALRYDVEEALGIELDEEFAEKAQTWLEGAKKDYSLKDIDLDIDL